MQGGERKNQRKIRVLSINVILVEAPATFLGWLMGRDQEKKSRPDGGR